MPTIVTRGALSAKAFGWTALTRSGNYWFATISGAVYGDGGPIFDSAGDLIYVGGDSTNGVYLAKLNNTTAATTWQKWYADTTIPGRNTTVTPASSGQFYITGWDSSVNARAVKFSSSASASWQRSYGNGAGTYTYAFSSVADASDNIIFSGQYQIAGCCCTTIDLYPLIIAKINSSGTYQWGLASTSISPTNGYGIDADSSGNIYVTKVYGGTSDLWLGKITSAGSTVPSFQIRLSGAGYTPYALKVASSGNIYSCLNRSGSGYGVVKFNSSGTYQWGRYNTAVTSQFIAVDASENVYIAGYHSANQATVIFKFDSSGSLQWARSVKSSSGATSPTGLAINGTTISLMCVNGSVYFTAKIPTDGSLTGAYTVGALTYTYSIPSLTATSVTDSSVSASATFTTFTPSSTTPTTAVNNAAATITVKNL